MPAPEHSQVAFLGVAERVAHIRDAAPQFEKWNILGLKNSILTYFFPTSLKGWNIGFAIQFSDQNIFPGFRFRIKTESDELIGQLDITQDTNFKEPVPITLTDGIYSTKTPKGWMLMFFPLVGFDAVITKPGRYFVYRVFEDETEENIGEFQFVLVNPIPMTPERIAAIRSDPHAIKAVRAEYGCKQCPSKMRVYAALERTPKLEADGYCWYQDIPEEFLCECKSTKIDLQSLKKNFYAPLGQLRPLDENQIGYVPLYESSALNSLRIDFNNLLDTNPAEEVIQKFIEGNPILLHQFPAERIFFKPAILTFFNADFAIVTPQKELILIEIEKTLTRLLKKDGGEAAQLGHAFDQVQSWLHTIDEHRLAVLDSLKIGREMVATVKGSSLQAAIVAMMQNIYDV